MNQNQAKGVTLIEMLLVMIIIASFIYMGTQYYQQKMQQAAIDKTVAQMQQILNAGLSYYVANGTWPPSIECLRADAASGCTIPYVSPNVVKLPPAFGGLSAYGAYTVVSNYLTTTFPNVYVYVGIEAGSTKTTPIANAIAGKLPMAFTTGFPSVNASGVVSSGACAANAILCYVVSSVNIPAQNLNSASSVNYAGLYHHGACVPVPTCPAGVGMTPQIYVVPSSVSGVNDPNSGNVYPISSFSAFVSGAPAATPPACPNGTASACTPISGNPPSSGTYWRVCLQITTEKGDVAVTNTGGTASGSYPYYPWGGNVTMMAITRCGISNEPTGSNFTVFTQ